MSAVRVVTAPLGGGALARAGMAGETPDLWYPRPLGGRAEWRTHVDAVRDGHAGGNWLEALAPALDPAGPAAGRLARVVGGRGVVVTTGQQPGLAGGPLYTWTKAVTALALADAIEDATGVPTAPVFWAATDDADFAEAAATVVAVPGGVARASIDPAAPDGTPMFRVPLAGDLDALVGTLASGAGAALFSDPLEAVAQEYVPGATVGSAYVRLLRRLLEPLGVAVLDAGHEALRTAADPVLRDALRGAEGVARALGARMQEIRRAGFEPQVAEVDGLSLVFDGLTSVKRRVPLDDAGRVAARAPTGDLGANVLLRPIVERRLLPTVAYTAGPGEFAYFAQVSAVADALALPRPHPVPRWSGTILEPHVLRILDRHGLAPDELRDPHAAEQRLAREALPDGVRAAIARFRADAEAFAGALRADAHAPGRDLVPDPVIEGFRRHLEHRLARLERRYLAAVKRREAQVMRDLATARGSLFPLGHRQERALNFLPLLARYGPDLFDRMREQALEHAAALVGSHALPPAPAAEITLL